MSEFVEFPKLARLSSDVIVTEKIDGTNAAVVITESTPADEPDASIVTRVPHRGGIFIVRAQSRSRFITPDDDNFGFATWVAKNAAELVAGLGEGRHFGEWWGAGIQRKYNQTEKRFSLFNVQRWCAADAEPQLIPSGDPRAEPKLQERAPACVGLVPILWRGAFDTHYIDVALMSLRANGSYAAPGFMKPEGIVVFHTAGNCGFKKTLEKDELPKSLAGAA